MKVFLLPFLFLCFSASLLAQNFSSTDPAYIENAKAGEAALKRGEYDDCLAFYATAFAIKQTSFLSTLRAAACAHSAGKTEIRDQYLDKAFELSPDGSKGIFENYDEFDYLRETPFAQMVSDRFMIAFPDYSPSLAEKLAKVRESDQAQRGLMREYSEKYGHNSPQMDSLWKIQTEADNRNTSYIMGMIDAIGYPGKSRVGDQASTAFLVIQHADLEIQEQYLPILREAAEAGELSWSSLALLIDRVEMRNGRPQIYGSQVSRDKETNEYFFSEIAEPHKIDSIRATVGLGPIQQYADNWNFTFDPDKHIARHKKE